MSEKTRKQDRRTRYTRQTIKDTFLELLKQKSFMQITVIEICKQIQTVIDKFIKAGLESFLIHDQREENASDNFCSKISPTVTASSTLR